MADIIAMKRGSSCHAIQMITAICAIDYPLIYP
jgi:hypothetical protein